MRSRSRSPVKFPNPLQILLPSTLFPKFNDREFLSKLESEASLDSVEISELLVLKLNSSKIANKLHALSLVLQEFMDKDPKTDAISIILLVPEPAIPVIMGRGNLHLQKIQEKSFTEIKIHEKCNLMLYRKVEIIGRTLDIETAVKKILIITKSFQTPPVKNSEDFTSKIRFILKSDNEKQVVDDTLIKSYCSDYSISLKAKNLNRDVIASISGEHQNCKSCIRDFIEKLTTTTDLNSKVTLLIPSVSVVKIIGPRGKLIREISSSSGGAKIIILGDKNTTKEQKNSQLVIEGCQETKLSAVLILFDLLNSIRKEHKFIKHPCDNILSVGAIVPDRLVSKLIGKSGVTVKSMMDDSDCSIAFLDNDKKVFTADGDKGRMVSLKGNTRSISMAVQIMLSNIKKFDEEEIKK